MVEIQARLNAVNLVNSYIICIIKILYNKNNEKIYIGETGKSVKSRLFCDGSGSHCNKRWFSEVEYVKYYKDENMKYDYRKMIERTLILYYRDKYRLYNDNL